MPATLPGKARVEIGDARHIPLKKASVDAILTSPPYLNAIDYMRGHRLSLVWFGYKLKNLREIRGASIGAERAKTSNSLQVHQIGSAMFSGNGIPTRFQMMIHRYADDLLRMSLEISRVLKPGGAATLVIGNSCLKGAFIKNSEGVKTAGILSGLQVVNVTERELPSSSRYLPITTSGALSKRMRTETVLTFRKPGRRSVASIPG
jgi:tRNA G10  N-methylase Trm11